LQIAQRFWEFLLQGRKKIFAVVIGADSGRGRQASTIDDASALVPIATLRDDRSFRIGHVAVTWNPERSSPSSIVSQPVEA
jgi:hypothetical protein